MRKLKPQARISNRLASHPAVNQCVRADVRPDRQVRNFTLRPGISTQARIVTALFCLIAASSVSPADADEGPVPQPEPFGVFENREEAFCRSTDMQGEHHCVCSAAGVEVPMTFKEFAYYIQLRTPDPGTARAVEAKLAQWARYCEPNR
jgi:hypothetical protein